MYSPHSWHLRIVQKARSRPASFYEICLDERENCLHRARLIVGVRVDRGVIYMIAWQIRHTALHIAIVCWE